MEQRGHFKSLTNIFARLIGLLPKSWIKFLFNRCRNIPGYVGLGLRYVCICNLAKRCGNNVAIFPNCVIKHVDNLFLGDNVSIHPYCYIDAIGGIEINDNVSIANHCSIISFGHTWANCYEPIKYNPLVMTPIKISSDVWIACGVRCIGPCEIDSRTIVAAGAVIKGHLLGNTIYGGVPAKIIKKMNDFNLNFSQLSDEPFMIGG